MAGPRTRVLLLHVGRRAQDPLCAAAEQFAARLSAYVCLKRVGLRSDAALCARAATARPLVVADERGAQLSTAEVAAALARWQAAGQRALTFVVGGAEGVPDTLRGQATALWALSRLTLPHRLAQVVLLEQLYRAHSLLAGSPYHHA